MAAERAGWRTRALDLLWAGHPDRLRDVPARVAPVLTNALRMTTAGVVSYLLTVLLTDGPVDLTGALTALLVMQVSAVGSLKMGLIRVGAVLTGILIALGLSSFVGLTWWSLLLVIFLSLIAARLFRLHEQALETPISAMLILSSVGTDVAAETRLITTVIGSVVGMVFPMIFPPAVAHRSASASVRDVGRAVQRVFSSAGEWVDENPITREAVESWVAESRKIGALVARAGERLVHLSDLRKLNSRAVGTADVVPVLESGLDTLDRCLLSSRTLFVVLANELPQQPAPAEDAAEVEFDEEARRAFAVVLADVGRCIGSFGELVEAEANGQQADAERSFAANLELLNETRAILTDLMMTAPTGGGQWMLQGSILSAIDQILQHLDLQNRVRRRQEWRASQFGLRLPQATIGPRLNPVSRAWVRRRAGRISDPTAAGADVQDFLNDTTARLPVVTGDEEYIGVRADPDEQRARVAWGQVAEGDRTGMLRRIRRRMSGGEPRP